MADDWLSQATPVPQAPRPGGGDWLSAAQPVDQSSAGPPRASFQNVTGGPQPPSPLSQFMNDVKAVPGQIATGAQAIYQGGDYPTDPNDQRRVLGVGEGMLRDAADITAGWANAAYQWSPMGVAERTAQHIINQFGGPTLPTVSNFAEAGTEAAHSVAGIDENTMRFQSPRQEAVARFVPELLSNAIPIGGAAHEADALLSAGERAVQAEAIVGVHGPEAQGTAVADQIVKGAGDLHITPEMRVPAAEVPDVTQPAAPVPDAALDTSARAGAGEAQGLPAGIAPEPAPIAATGAPEAAARAPESTLPSQPVAQPAEPDVLSHDDIDAMVHQGQLSPETANQLKGMVSREETTQVPTEHRTIAGEVPEPSWTGATVARDADGTPATVYRGSRSGETTPENFGELGAATGHPSAHLGVWFSESAADAGKYGTISEHHLDLRNPKVYDAAEFLGFDSPEEAAAFRKQLQAQGHDGVVVDARPYGGPRQFIAFEPHQVIHPIEKEAAHAGSLRESTGQADLGMEVPAGGEVGGRSDLQFPSEQEHPLPQRLRQGREEPTRPVQEPLGQTGIKHAQVDAERAALGYEAVKHDLSRTDPEGWARAEAKTAENPHYGRELAESLVAKPRAISKEEVFALTQDRQRIRTERRAAYTEAERAQAAGDTEGVAQARSRADRLDAEMDKNDVAARVTGHETAEGLRARQRLAQEDYSMAALVQRAKVKKGEALTADERTLMEAHAADIEKREAAVAAREAQVRAAEAKPRSHRVAKDASTRFDQLAEQMKQASRKILCEVA